MPRLIAVNVVDKNGKVTIRVFDSEAEMERFVKKMEADGCACHSWDLCR